MRTSAGRLVVLLVVVLVSTLVAQTRAPQGDALTARAVAAASTFLQRLSPEQRALAALDYQSPKKPTWHNGPPNFNGGRPGVKLGEMTPPQREAAMNLLQAVVGRDGYDKVNKIMNADAEFGTIMNAVFPTGPNAYSIAVYGTPSASEPWMVQWNGHHLGLNVTVVGGRRALSPTLTGAFPNVYEKDGKTITVLEHETGRAFKLMNALTPAQRSQATLTAIVGDLVLGPGQDGKVIQPEGLKGSEMTPAQKTMMLELAAAWITILPEAAAAEKLAEVKSRLDDTYFAWSGETAPGGRAYFRVQGPTVFIEYGPQVNAGGPGPRGGARGPQAPATPSSELPANSPRRDPNHVHTIYRDFTNEYGANYVSR